MYSIFASYVQTFSGVISLSTGACHPYKTWDGGSASKMEEIVVGILEGFTGYWMGFMRDIGGW